MKLFVVATPIGNLGDLTPRAQEILSRVPLVFAEDTRVAAKLLAHVRAAQNADEKNGARIAHPRVLALHHHTSAAAMKKLIAELAAAGEAALVTDAGTPGISDPGNLFIAALVAAHDALSIIPVPGASALAAALSVCGFSTDRFRMLGFPPHKNKRAKFFADVAGARETVVLFESVHRIKKTLADLDRVLGARPLMLARELTKLYETIYRGTAADILKSLSPAETKGEFVIVISAQ